MEAVAIAGLTVIVKGVADIAVSQLKEFIKRKKLKEEQNSEQPKTR